MCIVTWRSLLNPWFFCRVFWIFFLVILIIYFGKIYMIYFGSFFFDLNYYFCQNLHYFFWQFFLSVEGLSFFCPLKDFFFVKSALFILAIFRVFFKSPKIRKEIKDRFIRYGICTS